MPPLEHLLQTSEARGLRVYAAKETSAQDRVGERRVENPDGGAIRREGARGRTYYPYARVLYMAPGPKHNSAMTLDDTKSCH